MLLTKETFIDGRDMTVWNGDINDIQRSGYSLYDFVTNAEALDIPAGLFKDPETQCMYFIMAPNHHIINQIANNDDLFKQTIHLGEMDAKNRQYHFLQRCIKVCDPHEPGFNDVNSMLHNYLLTLDKIQDYAIMLKACRHYDIKKLPTYVTCQDSRVLADFFAKQNSGISPEITKRYKEMAKNYMDTIMKCSEKMEQRDYNIYLKNSPVEHNYSKDPVLKHAVDNLNYFYDRNISTVTVQLDSKEWDYIKKQIPNSVFIYYHDYENERGDYHLKDISKINAHLGDKNIWKNDGERSTFTITFPESDVPLFQRWSLEYLFKEVKTTVTKTDTINYIPLNEMIEKSKYPLQQYYIDASQWHNFTSLTRANNIYVSCDFDGSYTHTKRTLQDTQKIPCLIMREQEDLFMQAYNVIFNGRLSYVPEMVSELPDKKKLDVVENARLIEKTESEKEFEKQCKALFNNPIKPLF